MKIVETGVLGPLPTYSVSDILCVDITICSVKDKHQRQLPWIIFILVSMIYPLTWKAMLEACDAVVILVFLYVGCGFTMFLRYFRNVCDFLCTVR